MSAEDTILKLRELGKMARFEGGGFAVVAPFGAWAASGRAIEASTVGGLFLVNLLYLLGVCIHNDVADAKYDRLQKRLACRPLIAGTVSRSEAMVALGLCLAGCICLAWHLAPNPIVLLTLVGAMTFALLYNGYSKSMLGTDFFFALSAGLLCVHGGLSVMHGDGGMPRSAATLWMVAGIIMIDHFFFNAVEGGLKDFDNDASVGAPTMARLLFRERYGQLTFAAKSFFLGVKIFSAVLGFLPFVLGIFPVLLWQLANLSVVVVLMLLFSWQLVNVTPRQRSRVLKLTRLQEMACRSLIPLMLVGIIGVKWIIVLIVVPLLWFFVFNRLLYKRTFSNPKTE